MSWPGPPPDRRRGTRPWTCRQRGSASAPRAGSVPRLGAKPRSAWAPALLRTWSRRRRRRSAKTKPVLRPREPLEQHVVDERRDVVARIAKVNDLIVEQQQAVVEQEHVLRNVIAVDQDPADVDKALDRVVERKLEVRMRTRSKTEPGVKLVPTQSRRLKSDAPRTGRQGSLRESSATVRPPVEPAHGRGFLREAPASRGSPCQARVPSRSPNPLRRQTSASVPSRPHPLAQQLDRVALVQDPANIRQPLGRDT